MDWSQVIAGGLAGVGQGLGQVNDLRQQAIQNQLRQREFEAQQQERKRQAVMDAWNQIEGGTSLAGMAPEQVKDFTAAGLPLAKGPDGSLIKPKSKQQQLIETQLADREFELNKKREDEKFADELDNMDPTTFYALPPETREFMKSRAGKKDLETLTPEEKLRFSERLQSAQIAATAKMYAATAPRPVNPETMTLNRQKFEAGMRAKAAQLARTGMGAWMPPDQVAAQEEQIFQTLMQNASGDGGAMGMAPASPPALPTASRGKVIRITPMP